MPRLEPRDERTLCEEQRHSGAPWDEAASAAALGRKETEILQL